MIRLRRIATGGWVAGAVLAVVAVDWFLGTVWGTALLLVAVACLALREVFTMLAGAGIDGHPRWGVTVLGAALLLRAAEIPLGLTGGEARALALAVLAAGFTGPLMREVVTARGEITEPQPATLRRIGATSFALGYVGLLSLFVMELRMLPGNGGSPGHGAHHLGLQLTLLLAACVKVGDSMAYFVGRSVGRTPLCPVSPKKTWEGSFASLVGSVVTALVLGHIVFRFDVLVMLGFGIVADLAGQGGDLIESWLKRALGAKDSATTFGEMGGVLDMADAVLLAAPPAYLWAELLLVRGG